MKRKLSLGKTILCYHRSFLMDRYLVSDEPGRPGKPDIIDYDNKSVTLKWKKPENDGGRPILNYIIEMKDKFSMDWEEVAKTEDNNPEGKVEGLKEKMVYQFRVRAVNKAGASEPSEPTDNHVCKHRNCEYKLYTALFIPILFHRAVT